MALAKQAVDISFGEGLDTKTDPFRVPLGKFLALENSIFLKGKRLQKRNGYGALTSLPDTSSTFLTTFNGDLTAIGMSFQAYSSSANLWVNQGYIQPIGLSTLSLVKNNTNQSYADSAIAPNGLVCTVYIDQNPSSLSNVVYRYKIDDSETGQSIIAPTLLTTTDGTAGAPRVFVFNSQFIIVYTRIISAAYHLSFIAVSTSNPSSVTSPVDIANSYVQSTYTAFDGIVANGNLYIGWNGLSTTTKLTYIQPNLQVVLAKTVDASHAAPMISLATDLSSGVVWVSYWSNSTNNGYAVAVDKNMNSVLAATQIISSVTITNLTSYAQSGSLSFYFGVTNAYGYDSSIPSTYLDKNTISQAGSVESASVVRRSVDLASKAFAINGVVYFLAAYQSPYQPTFYILDSSGHILAQLAYQNGGGYLLHGLPSVNLSGNVASVAYLLKDLVIPVNKNTNVPSGSQTAGVFTQTGISLASFSFLNSNITSAEIGNNLNVSGGFLWGYDGYAPVEQNFFLYPDSVEVQTSTSGGNLAADTYYYQVTYEWTDNQGNAFKSAPSIPVSVTTTGATSSNTINFPYLRLTYKTANPVKIVIYRWSTNQQTYYAITSITTPILNSVTSDAGSFADTLADASILGNPILYTTGGVLENTAGPAFDDVFLFDDRLWGIDSEDKNLLWFSKQVIEATPLEMSQYQTFYVAPNIGAQGNTGPLKCGFAMDDKAILFKASAINYFNGTGPDATGANSQYSQPIFVTSTVGCSNPNSIVFQPQGLMFEFSSQAGNQIWLLGRDLSTSYIGAPVENLTANATVESAVNIPGTNQIRFAMSSGITLMYDYFYGQWGTFTNVPAISSTVFEGVQAFLNNQGQVFQETPGVYLDGSSPVLMSFTTSWANLAGLQGYERAYYFYLMGTYATPHKLNVQIAYDYAAFPSSFTVIAPSNYAPTYGQSTPYGQELVYGTSLTLEQWRVFLTQQRCQSFQITINELYDPSWGVQAGAGFTLSGLNLIVGLKKGYRPIKAAHSVGTS